MRCANRRTAICIRSVRNLGCFSKDAEETSPRGQRRRRSMIQANGRTHGMNRLQGLLERLSAPDLTLAEAKDLRSQCLDGIRTLQMFGEYNNDAYSSVRRQRIGRLDKAGDKRLNDLRIAASWSLMDDEEPKAEEEKKEESSEDEGEGCCAGQGGEHWASLPTDFKASCGRNNKRGGLSRLTCPPTHHQRPAAPYRVNTLIFKNRYVAGTANNRLSTRSRNPPWPGKLVPLSLVFRERLRRLSARSPS